MWWNREQSNNGLRTSFYFIQPQTRWGYTKRPTPDLRNVFCLIIKAFHYCRLSSNRSEGAGDKPPYCNVPNEILTNQTLQSIPCRLGEDQWRWDLKHSTHYFKYFQMTGNDLARKRMQARKENILSLCHARKSHWHVIKDRVRSGHHKQSDQIASGTRKEWNNEAEKYVTDGEQYSIILFPFPNNYLSFSTFFRWWRTKRQESTSLITSKVYCLRMYL